MKTVITLEIEHSKPIPHLADMVAGRAWSIDGVRHAEVAGEAGRVALPALGSTREEMDLGRREVVRA